MQHVEPVQIFECFADLLHNISCGAFTEPFLFLDDLVQLSFGSQLQKQIYVLLIVEKAVELRDIGVIKARLYFELSDKLPNDLLFDD